MERQKKDEIGLAVLPVSGRGNIHRRLLLPYVLTLIASILAAWWIATSVLTRSLEERLANRLQHAATVVVSGDLPLTDELLARVGRLLNASVILLTPAGQVAKSIVAEGPDIVPVSLHKDWNDAASAGNAQTLESAAGAFMVVARAIKTSHDPRYGTLVLASSLDDIREASRQAAFWLGVAALLGAGVIAWVGHRIALTITEPIKRLAAAAREVAAGKRDVRIDAKDVGEIGTLTHAFNAMVQSLEEYERQATVQSRYAALGEMAARVAHEVRNPLTAIKMQLQLLAETLGPGDTETCDRLVDEVRRLELIVNAMLQQGRASPLQLAPADLNRILDDVAHLFRPYLAHQGIELETSLARGLPQVPLDIDRFKQVIVNLLVNARDALGDGGTIRIETALVGERGAVVLAVSDSGPGIPREKWSTLFSAAPSSSKPQGLGLGMRLVAELVQGHGGRLSVGEADIGGALFEIEIPIEPV